MPSDSEENDSHDGDFDNDDEDKDITYELPQKNSQCVVVAKKTSAAKKCYNKKVEKKWSQEDTLKLIGSIEARPSLWDMSSPAYKLPKEMVWQEIADQINDGRSVNDCKGKWQNLRTTFNSKLSAYRKKKSGQGTDETISIVWPFFDSMMFLEVIKVRQSTSSTPSMSLVSSRFHSHLIFHF